MSLAEAAVIERALPARADPWSDAGRAICLLAVDPIGLGGMRLRGRPGPVRDRLLALLRERVGEAMPWRKLPPGIGQDRLLGGLDLAATLAAGRPVAETGLLAQADGGILLAAMAERLPASIASPIAHALDTGEVVVERDGLGQRSAARFGLLLLDEGDSAEDEQPPAGLIDRLAFCVELDSIGIYAASGAPFSEAVVAAGRERLGNVRIGDDLLTALCEAGDALGIASPRAVLLALNAIRANAALEGRDEASPEDAALAARLVLAPRATRIPQADAQQDEAQPEPPSPDSTDPAPEPPPSAEAADDANTDAVETPPLTDLVLDAAAAALPAALLAAIAGGASSKPGAAGRSGAASPGKGRGRRIGSRRGDPRQTGRLDLLATLRAAAPWQRLRTWQAPVLSDSQRPMLSIRRDDFRVPRLLQKQRSTTIFAVDASGSAAMHRLAEAKGAVELLLGECYIRRDEVALIAFRDRRAELLLPPTRSLPRAKACLAALPGGGGTPLAAGIDAARLLAEQVRRSGQAPLIVIITDGQGNIARDGSPGRPRAEADALAAAAGVAVAGLRALLIDASPRPQSKAAKLAGIMGARYLALPRAEAGAVLKAIQGPQINSTRAR